jgi:hypothetical protein
MIAAATRPTIAIQTPSPQPPPQATTDETEELAVRWLVAVVLKGKPRRAIAAFRALTLLCKFYKETHARIVELSRTGRPAIAAAAASALVRSELARRRYRDGRSPLLRF